MQGQAVFTMIVKETSLCAIAHGTPRKLVG
jgi:hypothetical protein